MSKQQQTGADAVNEQVEAMIKDWPLELRLADPGRDGADPMARLAWAQGMVPIAQRLNPPPKAPNTESGKGTGGQARQGKAGVGSRLEKPDYPFQKPGDVAW